MNLFPNFIKKKNYTTMKSNISNINKVLETKKEQLIYEKLTNLINQVTWIEKLPKVTLSIKLGTWVESLRDLGNHNVIDLRTGWKIK